jgi:hypothetical protein
MCLYPNITPFNFIGGYSNSFYTNLSDSIEAPKRHYTYKNLSTDISNVSINYLDSIMILCKRNHIQLVAITTPLHNSYLSRIPAKFITSYNFEKKNLIKNGAIIIDHGHEKYPNSFYLNSDHLNEKGAEKFTSQIAEF